MKAFTRGEDTFQSSIKMPTIQATLSLMLSSGHEESQVFTIVFFRVCCWLIQVACRQVLRNQPGRVMLANETIVEKRLIIPPDTGVVLMEQLHNTHTYSSLQP